VPLRSFGIAELLDVGVPLVFGVVIWRLASWRTRAA
jgi:hypothetical protein